MALVTVPTYELAIQVYYVAIDLLRNLGHIYVAAMFGAVPKKIDKTDFSRQYQILIATLVWLLDLAENSLNLLTLSHVRYLILDEVNFLPGRPFSRVLDRLSRYVGTYTEKVHR